MEKSCKLCVYGTFPNMGTKILTMLELKNMKNFSMITNNSLIHINKA